MHEVMHMDRESICCKELEQTMSILEECDPLTCPKCVTQHSEFATVCLCRTVLLVSLHSHHHGSSDVLDDENRYITVNEAFFLLSVFIPSRRFQYLAYRQMTRWGWHYLGRHRRVVLLSCVVMRIRCELPSAEYT